MITECEEGRECRMGNPRHFQEYLHPYVMHFQCRHGHSHHAFTVDEGGFECVICKNFVCNACESTHTRATCNRCNP